jgi:hypothetical protein
MNIGLLNIIGFFGFGILTFCFGIYRITNGRMIEITRRLNHKVEAESCHRAQDSLKEHIDTRVEDLKTFMKNGNKEKK